MKIAPKQIDLTKDIVSNGGRFVIAAKTSNNLPLGFKDSPTTGMYFNNSDGSLNISLNGTDVMKVDSQNSLKLLGNSALALSSGSTANRPSSPTNGMIRYNTDLSSIECYQGNTWKSISTSVAGNEIPLPMTLFPYTMDSPNNSDWAVNAFAPITPDPMAGGVFTRAFDDTTVEGVGFNLRIPNGATNLIMGVMGRASSSPITGKNNLKFVWYFKRVSMNQSVVSWNNVTLDTWNSALNTNYQEFTQTINLSQYALGSGDVLVCELCRNGSNSADTLVGDFLVLGINIRWS